MLSVDIKKPNSKAFNVTAAYSPRAVRLASLKL